MDGNIVQLGVLVSLTLAAAAAWARLREGNQFWVGFTSGAWALYLALIVFIIATQHSLWPSSQTPQPQIAIMAPQSGDFVPEDEETIPVKGISSNLPKEAVIWIFTKQALAGETPRFFVQRHGPITPFTNGDWTGEAYFSKDDKGQRFEIWAVATEPSINDLLKEYIASVDRNRGPIPFLRELPPFRQFSASHNIFVNRK